MITKESIERVNDADLIEILEKCNLQDFKKAGANYRARSPFVNEKTPSFMASKTKQVWKCFSSGNGGVGAVSFIMAKDKLSWIDAIEKVAQLQNIILERADQTPEEIERQDLQEQRRKVLLASKLLFKKNFIALDEKHWARLNLSDRGYDVLTLEQFEIGYATPNSNEITSPLKEKGRLDDGIKAGVVKDKEGRTFDFFNDRVIFPILDERGRTIGFGGRASNEAIAQKKTPKYLNSPDTEFYKKEEVLFGLFQARASIIKRAYAYLGEGYTDVMGFFDKKVDNIVATCGTALTKAHIAKLKKLCKHIILVRDGDAAGLKATYRDIDLCLEANIKVSVVEMPPGEDPDSIAKAQGDNLEQWLQEHMFNALLWKAAKLRSESSNADQIAEAVELICESLVKIGDPIKRKEYVKDCAKNLKVGNKDLQSKIDGLVAVSETKRKHDRAKVYEDEKHELMAFGFPEDGDVAQYKRDGYAISEKNMCIYFENAKESFSKGTNFIVNPLFVIRSAKNEGKRLVEFTSQFEQTVFAFNNKEVTNFSQFQEKIVDGYNFTFEPSVTAFHFKQFRNKLLYNFRSAYELYTLGQQPEGFYAFANGVVVEGDFYAVDDYGIVEVNVEADPENNKKAIQETFYSPAFSKINIAGRGDEDDAFEGVREFSYKESEVTFNQWMHIFYKVYEPEKAMVGIAFLIACLFRDIIVAQFSSFPHLFLTGQRQSGKTKFSESLTYVFTPGQKSFDLNTGTMVGFFRRISKIKNIVVGLEEFTDLIHEVKFQTLKAAYDNRGRETGAISGGDKGTNLTKVQSGCIILSQYLSTRDDNSLPSRSIPLSFIERNYTPDQKAQFSKLKSLERQGMTSMLVELLKYRPIIEKSLSTVIEELNRDISKKMKGDVMERMLDNFVAIMAPVKILFTKFVFPFTWSEFEKTCIDMIVQASSMIHETEGTATFWRTLEYLLDQKRIHDGVEFIIDPKPTFKYKNGKGEQQEYINPSGDKILFLRLGKVHQDYQVEVSRRKNEDPIGEATLREYFKSKNYYIGAIQSMHFETGAGSCYAFNYSQMENSGVLNLVREFKKEAATPSAAQIPGSGITGTEDLPF
ncbi:DNA primase [Flavobacterium psychrotrophum]|uniref:DNA primase n=1 Tax=Flavobacterium psychrotrophum TaxID=2294119 RepID=UPI000E320220|nr:DNA primase [Flavobacterium psychrotrophum]